MALFRTAGGCTPGTATARSRCSIPNFCQGGLLIVDPHSSKTVYGAFDAATNTGVLALSDCGPNGATVGPHGNLMLGCTPQNVPTNTTTQVINAKTKHFVEVGNITG